MRYYIKISMDKNFQKVQDYIRQINENQEYEYNSHKSNELINSILSQSENNYLADQRENEQQFPVSQNINEECQKSSYLASLSEAYYELYRQTFLMIIPNREKQKFRAFEKKLQKEHQSWRIITVQNYQEAKTIGAINKKSQTDRFIILISETVENFSESIQKMEKNIKIVRIIAVFDKNIERGLQKNSKTYKISLEQIDMLLEIEQCNFLNESHFHNFSSLSIEKNYRQIGYISRYQMFTFLEAQNSGKSVQDLKYFLQKQKDKSKKKQIEIQLFYKQYNFSCQDAQDSKLILKWYTNQSFYYRLQNKALRMPFNPKVSFYFRLICSHTFKAVKSMQRQQTQILKDKLKDKILYRGGILSQNEIKYLSKRQGDYIQFDFFLSSSLDRQIANNYTKNCLFMIKIPEQKLENVQINTLQTGFALLEDISGFKKEKQVLFNALNVFKVKKITQIQKKNLYQIELVYGLEKQDTNLKAFGDFHFRQKKWLKSYGDLLIQLRKNRQAEKFFLQKSENLNQVHTLSRTAEVFIRNRPSISFELYCKIIKQSRQSLKKYEVKPLAHLEILVKVPGYKYDPTFEKYGENRLFSFYDSIENPNQIGNILYGKESYLNVVRKNNAILDEPLSENIIHFYRSCLKKFEQNHEKQSCQYAILLNNFAVFYHMEQLEQCENLYQKSIHLVENLKLESSALLLQIKLNYVRYLFYKNESEKKVIQIFQSCLKMLTNISSSAEVELCKCELQLLKWKYYNNKKQKNEAKQYFQTAKRTWNNLKRIKNNTENQQPEISEYQCQNQMQVVILNNMILANYFSEKSPEKCLKFPKPLSQKKLKNKEHMTEAEGCVELNKGGFYGKMSYFSLAQECYEKVIKKTDQYHAPLLNVYAKNNKKVLESKKFMLAKAIQNIGKEIKKNLT